MIALDERQAQLDAFEAERQAYNMAMLAMPQQEPEPVEPQEMPQEPAPVEPLEMSVGGDASLKALLAQNTETLSDELPEEAPINTDPVGTAQKMLASLTQTKKSPASPTAKSIKKAAGKGGASTGKEMEMAYEPLSAARDLVPQLKETGSARSQMEALAKAYKLRSQAATEQAKGFLRDTMNAPTLDKPNLGRATLAAKRFNEGGEVSGGSSTGFVTGKPIEFSDSPYSPYSIDFVTAKPIKVPLYDTNDQGGGNPVTNPFSDLTQAQQAAYYAANPTMAGITQLGQKGFGLTSLGMLQNALVPGFVSEQAQIAMGIDPAAYQSARESFRSSEIADMNAAAEAAAAQSISDQSSAGSEAGGYGTGDTSGGFGEGQYNRGGLVRRANGGGVDKQAALPEPTFIESSPATRTFLNVLGGRREPLTEKDFTPSEHAAMLEVIRNSEARGKSPKGRVDYGDYPSAENAGPGYKDIRNTLGGFGYQRDPEGGVTILDKYDFHGPRVTEYERMGGLEKAASTAKNALLEFLKQGGPRDLAGEIGRAYIGTKGPEVKIRIAPPVKRAGGSPEEGEVYQSGFGPLIKDKSDLTGAAVAELSKKGMSDPRLVAPSVKFEGTRNPEMKHASAYVMMDDPANIRLVNPRFSTLFANPLDPSTLAHEVEHSMAVSGGAGITNRYTRGDVLMDNYATLTGKKSNYKENPDYYEPLTSFIENAQNPKIKGHLKRNYGADTNYLGGLGSKQMFRPSDYEELAADLGAAMKIGKKDIFADPFLQKNLFNNDPYLMEAVRSTLNVEPRADAKDLQRLTAYPQNIDRFKNLIRKRAKGSPEEGELSQEEIDAASKPAFVTPKSGKGRKEGPISQALNSGEAYVNMAKGLTEMPYNLAGAPMDLVMLARQGLTGQAPAGQVGTSDYIKNKMTELGIRQAPPTDPTAKGFYTAGDLLSNLVNPASVPRKVGPAIERGVKAGATEVGRQLDRAIMDNAGPLAGVVPDAARPMYAVRPTGSMTSMGNPAADSRLERLIADGRRGEGVERTTEGMENFWNVKARNYFEKQFGTPDDPIADALKAGRIKSEAVQATDAFPSYLVDQLSVGKTRRREGERPEAGFVGPGAPATRFFPKYPQAMEEFTSRYDTATGLKGDVVTTAPGMSHDKYPNMLSPLGDKRLTEAKDTAREMLAAQGVRDELANPNIELTARLETDPTLSTGYSTPAKVLLAAYEKTKQKPSMLSRLGLASETKPEETLSQSVVTAIEKGEPIYDTSGIKAPLRSLFDPSKINKYLTTLPERELKKVRFEDVVQGANKMFAEEDAYRALADRIRNGKNVPDKVFSDGVSSPLLQFDKKSGYNGYSWKRLETPESTVPEGAYLGHSVGGYKLGGVTYSKEKMQAFKDGRYQVYTLRDNRNRPVTTVEVQMIDDYTPAVMQIKGNGRASGNTAPEDYDYLVLEFLDKYLHPAQISEKDAYLTPLLQRYKDGINATFKMP